MDSPAVTPPPPPGFIPQSVSPAAPPPPPPGFVPAPAAAPSTPAAPAAPTDAPTAWQALKTHLAANVDRNLNAPDVGYGTGWLNDAGRGIARGGMQTIGGLLDIYRKLGDQAHPDDLAHYMQTHPGAAPEDAAAAVTGKDPKGNPTQPYRAPGNSAAHEDTKAAADWFRQHGNTEGFWEGLGSGGEALAELLGTGGLSVLGDVGKAGEVVGVADQLANSQKVASFLTKNPKVAKLAALGMRVLKSGAEAGGQTFVKTGGDATATAEGAGLGIAGGAAGEAIGAGVTGVARKLANPSLTTGAIEDAARGTVADRLAETNATRTLQPNRLPPSTGDFQFKIAGTPTEESVEGSTVADPRKKQIGTQYVAGKGSGSAPKVDAYDSGTFMHGDQPALPAVNDQVPFAGKGHKEPVFQYLTGVKPGTENPGVDVAKGGGTLLTKDADVASAHLASLDKIIQGPEFAGMSPELQQSYQAQRDDIQQQLGDFYKHQKATGAYAPNFQPRDVQSAIASTGDFADAAKQLEDAGKEVYEHANRVSGGQWQSLKDAISDTSEKLMKEPDIPANRAVRARLTAKMRQMQSAMDGILQDPRNGIDQTDVDQAVRNWHAKFTLEEAHKAIQGIYEIEQHQPLVTGQYKGFNGNRLGARWKSFLDSRPEARSIIGSDRVDTLQRLFDANDTMAARKRFGNAVMSVATAAAGYHFGGLEGTIAGEGAYQGTRYVLNGILANPKVAKNLLFAIDSGARPENYAPGLAKMIADGMKTSARAVIPVAAGAAVRDDYQSQDQGGQ